MIWRAMGLYSLFTQGAVWNENFTYGSEREVYCVNTIIDSNKTNKMEILSISKKIIVLLILSIWIYFVFIKTQQTIF